LLFPDCQIESTFAIRTGVLAAGCLSAVIGLQFLCRIASAARLSGLQDLALSPVQPLPVWAGFFKLGCVDWCDIVHAMGFRVISGTAIREFVENLESATAALDRVRQLIEWGLPNIRILTEDGRVCSLAELEGLAEFENESDDA
jgi:hypothetical protein